jgi:transcription elongation GreA/GreB family factor
VKLEHEDGYKYYFIAPKEGGQSIYDQDHDIFVVSPFSPMGHALMGKSTGDEIEVKIKNSLREYRILEVK